VKASAPRVPPRAAAASPSLDAAAPGLAAIRLGDLVIDPPLFLAPMAGFTNLAFRRIVKRLGCGLTTTEMVLAHGVVRDHPRTLALAALSPEERPAGVQIAGGEPEILAEAAARLVDRGADLIDINMGCPVRKIVERCAGAALLKDPALAAAAVDAVRRRVSVPVTVKIRAGWDDVRQSVTAAKALEDAGAAAIAVHGRTREQQYRGRSDLEAIANVKDAVSVPVIGNGDVMRPEDAAEMIRKTGVDGVMVGRAALRDPWIFGTVAQTLRTGVPPPPPTAAARRAVLAEFFEETAALRGERVTVLQMRKFASMYLRGFPGARNLRVRIQSMDTREDFEAVLTEVFAEGAPAPLVPDHERLRRRSARST
jgi:tRNA-dihydrouridine synthase B